MNEITDTNKMISELVTNSRMLGFYAGLITGIVGTCIAFFAAGKF